MWGSNADSLRNSTDVEKFDIRMKKAETHEVPDIFKDSTCASRGACGKAYQACCIGYKAAGYPCGCELKDGTGVVGDNCGVCGTAYGACCVGYKAKGFPCTCDLDTPSATATQ